MTEQQITLARALDLVSFHLIDGEWQVKDVQGHVTGNVKGCVVGSVSFNVLGNVDGDVFGHVKGDVCGNVEGNVRHNVNGRVRGHVKGGVGGNVNGVGGHVFGTINGKHWLYVESPKEKLARLIEEQGNEELLEAFNQAMRPTQENN